MESGATLIDSRVTLYCIYDHNLQEFEDSQIFCESLDRKVVICDRMLLLNFAFILANSEFVTVSRCRDYDDGRYYLEMTGKDCRRDYSIFHDRWFSFENKKSAYEFIHCITQQFIKIREIFDSGYPHSGYKI